MKTAALLVPDEIAAAPGAAEAGRIRELYGVAIGGLRAFVEMGFCLVDVKARLPHGQYIAWCGKHLPDLKRTHLYNAQLVATGLMDMAGIKCSPRRTFDMAGIKCNPRVTFADLPPEVLSIIDGATGYRALLATVHEYRDDEAEQAARKACEAMFAADAGLRDEWEPRVLSGELTWCQAVKGIAGQVATKGGKRAAPNYNRLITESLTTLKNGVKCWTELKDGTQAKLVAEMKEIIALLPPGALQQIGIRKDNGK